MYENLGVLKSMGKSLHGGNLYETSKEYGIDEKNILDFSANINPLGISKQLKQALIASIDDLVNYPDYECNELRNELSHYINVPIENIIAGNGASEIIYLLFEVLKPLRILMPAPCFAEYARAAGICDAGICYYKLSEEDGFRLNIKDFIQNISDDIDAIMICNPNNPTSALIDREDLLHLIDYAHKRNINIIVDEAFIELTAGVNINSVASFVKQYGSLFVVRALTKVMAIPGLRLGYAIGDSSVIEKMQKRKIPWSVNTFACNIGKVLNGDTAYFEETARWLSAEKEWLYNELVKIKKLKIFKPETNFILIKILDKDINSSSLRDLMISKGILIRDASSFMFLDERFIRVAIKDRKANNRLVAALYEIFTKQ